MSDQKDTPNLPNITFILLFLLSLFLYDGNPKPEFVISSDCQSNSSYTTNSTYHANLKLLLTTISSTSSTLDGTRRFHNITVGQAPDAVYGLYLCSGDVTNTVCQDCVETACSEIVSNCQNPKEMISWYEQCMLRYSHRLIFSVMTETPLGSSVSDVSIDDSGGYDEVVAETMEVMINQAAYNSSREMFATQEVNYKGSQYKKIYCLVQCTPDILGGECYQCLHDTLLGIPNCCSGKLSAAIFRPSCNLRFSVNPFYGSLAPTTPVQPSTGKGTSSRTVVGITVPIVVLLAIFFFAYCFRRKNISRKEGTDKPKYSPFDTYDQRMDLLVFDLERIMLSTGCFSVSNRIGEGGFGVVYKGILENGQEIAVKRLSRNSNQGNGEFKNEILLLSRLQHKNLACLLGFCIEGDEKLLIYEFVPNKSLDVCLFNSTRPSKLSWEVRRHIINEIARGLLYLHEESPLKIIHRDLKPSNVLLGNEMNAKISDFGMARLFGENQDEDRTRRVVGTYGYMAPEYAMAGKFSVKSDVFSFGVILLGLVSGKRNSAYFIGENDQTFLGHAWQLWKEGKEAELIHPILLETCGMTDEIMRCIQIGLLCVQEDPTYRPAMSTVVAYLRSETKTLPQPRKPAFFVGDQIRVHSSSTNGTSVNEVTLSASWPR